MLPNGVQGSPSPPAGGKHSCGVAIVPVHVKPPASPWRGKIHLAAAPRGSLHFATCRRGRIHLATFCRGSLHFAASRRGWKSSFAGPRARPDPATPCGAWPEMARTRGCFVRPGIPSRLDAACRGSLHLVRGKHNQPLFLTFPPRPGVFVGATLPLHHRAKPRSRTRHSASANDFRPRPNACAGTSPQGVALHQTSAP